MTDHPEDSRDAATLSRRRFLQLLGAGAVTAACPPSIRKAMAIPAHHRTGTIKDVEHIVFLMQENRSFDHYFGSLRGVRGFGDPHPARLPDGQSVWAQPDANGPVLPFHPGAPDLGLRFLEDLAHDWTSTQKAWNLGRHDGWVRQKGATTMAYLDRGDIPFHYALADAFTVCDAYHCSLLGPTDPNRMHMWSGWVGNDGSGGGPVIDDAELGYAWRTYPERLEQAGVSWKIYQDIGPGLNAHSHWGWIDDAYAGTYGDSTLLYFKQYQNAKPGSPLYQKARTGTQVQAGDTLFQQLQRDVHNDDLPQISWIVSPEAYCEHPNWPANYGAWYTSQVLDALTSNPEVWSKTVVFLMYDENDGFFDHAVPPTPPMSPEFGQSTVSVENEIFPGTKEYQRGPYGLGVRVPMMVISPWSKGGWASSEVFDHTSLLRFAEQRFGVRADNITPWRRAVCGDLTSTLDFANPNRRTVPLPSTANYVPPDHKRHPDYKPRPPTEPRMPTQEPGQRPARPVPYRLHVDPRVTPFGIKLTLRNTGTAAAVFQVRSAAHAPRCHTVGAHADLQDHWKSEDAYALEVHGPNGYYRALAGKRDEHPGEPVLRYNPTQHAIELHLTPTTPVQLTIRDAYTRQTRTHDLPSGQTWHHSWPLAASHGWYDLDVHCADFPTFRRRFAGHLETGKNSMTDPQLGART